MKRVYRAVNTFVVTAVDGVDHVYHFTKDLLIHGGKGAAVSELEGLREGTTVVVHYTADGAEARAEELDRLGPEGLAETEGMVTRIDRGRKQITIRFDSGTMETFQLTERAVAEADADIGPNPTRIVIYYAEANGEKVAHFFKKTP